MVDLRKIFWAFLLQLVVGSGLAAAQQRSVLTVQEALKLYLSRNPEIEAERERVEMARGDLRQASLVPNPRINYSQEGFPLGADSPSYANDQEFLFWVTQELELGGKRSRRKEVARSKVEVVQAQFDDWLRHRKAQLKEIFARAYFAQRRRGLARQHVDTYHEIREIHRHRYEAGDVSGLSQLRLDLEEVRFVSTANQTETEFVSAWTDLTTLILWPRNDLPQLELTRGAFPEEEVEALKDLAYRSRPDLLALASQVGEMEARIGLAESERIPNLTLGGGYKRDFGVNSFYAAVQLPIPLFNRNQGAIARARAELRHVKNQQLWTRIQVGAEVEAAYEIYRARQSTADRLQIDLLGKAERVLEVTRESYREGEASLTDYLDALRVRLDASLAYYDVLLQLQTGRLALEKATGADLP